MTQETTKLLHTLYGLSLLFSMAQIKWKFIVAFNVFVEKMNEALFGHVENLKLTFYYITMSSIVAFAMYV